MRQFLVCSRFWLALVVIISANVACTPSVDAPTEALIRLERTSCLGTCPVYSVTIDARGNVTYDGNRHVRAVGRHTSQIAPASVATLLQSAQRIRFFDLRDEYRQIAYPNGSFSSPSDLPTTIVTITADGRTKRVEDYVGAPDVLVRFEQEIDDAAVTRRWIFLDDPTLTALTSSGWSASTEEGAAILQQAIERDDIPIARRLIQMGSDLGGPARNRLPPLITVRSRSMVELLVKAGADPNERPIGRVGAETPLMKSAYREAGVAEALLAAGARIDDIDEGRTALMYAACYGNWRVVTVLLRAGANPTVGISAVECAREIRFREANRPRTVLDRGLPTVEDFDRTITLLEEAEKRTRK